MFSDAAKRDQLNRIMQPLILAQIRQELQQALTDAVPVVVLDMPLLFEEGLDRLCDSVWCVSLPRPLQLRRIMERDGCTRETAEARIAAQLAPEEKSRRSDVVIDTSGTMEETARMIPALYARELALA